MIEDHIPYIIEEDDDLTIINEFYNNNSIENNNNSIKNNNNSIENNNNSIENNNYSIENNNDSRENENINNNSIEINIQNENSIEFISNKSKIFDKKKNCPKYKLYYNKFSSKFNELYNSYPYFKCLKDSADKEYACIVGLYFSSMFIVFTYII